MCWRKGVGENVSKNKHLKKHHHIDLRYSAHEYFNMVDMTNEFIIDQWVGSGFGIFISSSVSFEKKCHCSVDSGTDIHHLGLLIVADRHALDTILFKLAFVLHMLASKPSRTLMPSYREISFFSFCNFTCKVQRSDRVQMLSWIHIQKGRLKWFYSLLLTPITF